MSEVETLCVLVFYQADRDRAVYEHPDQTWRKLWMEASLWHSLGRPERITVTIRAGAPPFPG